MHRIDHPTADANANGVGKAGFTEGNPGIPTPATVVTDDWLNDVQENILNVLTAAGITPVKGDFDNLVDAITAIAASSAGLWVDGNAAGPGARFASDTDTGLFRPGANRMGVSVGGVQVAEWEADGRYKAVKPSYGPEVALTDAATIAVDMSLGNNFGVQITTSRTLGLPTNQKTGQAGVMRFKQPVGGGATLSFAAGWLFENGEVPVLAQDANATSLIGYYTTADGPVAFLKDNVKVA